MRAVVVLGSGLLVSLPLLAHAATQTVTEQASYALGDNDTRAQARDICLAKVERKALEESGSLVESEMDMISAEKAGGVSDQAQQHVRSYVGAVVTAAGVKDQFRMDGERIVIDCAATVTFNPDDVRDRLKAVRTDNTTKAQVDQQQARIAALEAQVQNLSLKLATQAQAQALTQAQQSQLMTQAQQAQVATLQQTQAYAQGQALAQIERQGPPALPPPRPYYGYGGYGNPPPPPFGAPPPPRPGSPPPYPPQASAGTVPPAPGGNEPPPPAAQPRLQVEVAPLSPNAAGGAPVASAAVAPPTVAQAAPPAAAASVAPQTAAPITAQLAALRSNPQIRSIRAGMNAVDLVKMIGAPRASIHEATHVYSWDYGGLWVTINAGLVQCVSPRENPGCLWARVSDAR
jgi:hypothetical protein